MQSKDNFSVTSNQRPDSKNRLSRFARNVISYLMPSGVVSSAGRPKGISVYMRVKDERDWIAASIASVKGIADEIIIADNGSTDGTYEILEKISMNERKVKLWRKPALNYLDLSNFVLNETGFRWILKWDGDFIAHTSGSYDIAKLKDRIYSLNPKSYYIIYMRLINLSGDLFHQDPQEMVHIEEYLHTFSEAARFIHTGHFEAIRFPFYYKPLFWYEPFVFHVNVKSARRMLLRYFWDEWLGLKNYVQYPALEDYVLANIKKEFGTSFMEEAQRRCVNKMLQNHIPFDTEQFGPYPEMLRPLLEETPYRIQYQNGRISGRTEPEDDSARK